MKVGDGVVSGVVARGRGRRSGHVYWTNKKWVIKRRVLMKIVGNPKSNPTKPR